MPILVCQPQLFSDLSRSLGIDFAARQRGEFIADIHHGVTAFALAVINPKTQALRASFVPDLRDEAVSFVHLPRRVYRSKNRTILSECQSVRTKRSGAGDLLFLDQPVPHELMNTEFRILFGPL